MESFIARPSREQLELIRQTAAKLDMAPAAIEKDFWVCWMLQRLFRSSLRDSIIFQRRHQPVKSIWPYKALFRGYRPNPELGRLLQGDRMESRCAVRQIRPRENDESSG